MSGGGSGGWMDCGCIMQTLHSHIIICCVCVSSSRRIYIFSQFMPGMFWCYLLVLCALFYKLVSLRLLHTDGLETGLVWKHPWMIRVMVHFPVLLNWVSLKTEAEVAQINYKWSKGTVIIGSVHNQWTIEIFSMKTYTWINKPKISWPRGDEWGDNQVWGYIRCRECVLVTLDQWNRWKEFI